MTAARPANGTAAAAAGVLADLVDLGGAGLVVTELAPGWTAPAVGPGAVRVGVHRSRARPAGDLERFDILLSADAQAPRPWVGVGAEGVDAALARLAAAVDAQPAAAAVAAQVLRMSLTLPFDQALVLESLAYSMLLASEGFAGWRAANPARLRADDGRPRVQVAETESRLVIRLDRAEARNAFDARMRDALVEAFEFALAHPDAPPVELSGLGPVFSAGGDLDEFGRADDAGLAHLIRTLRAPARLARALGPRLAVRVHGAGIGAGIEVPAAAARVTLAPGTVLRLPEVAMGLIPGAGGTATIPRRIGRRRAAWMAISGAEVDAATAVSWGLADALGPGP
ncbi:MAG: enoyl-CoA hydratase/isomerase family protein [Caulobacterales bacterium]|nr:enoyl-CoA hydratase/isomerase family protein [Caulobacterales bacterium]